jgi:hypothetical protein
VHKDNSSLALAFNAMTRDRYGKRYTSVSYEIARKRFVHVLTEKRFGCAWASGKDNHMYGKSILEAWVDKLGEEEAVKRYNKYCADMSARVSGDKNGFYGKTHTKETRDRLSESRKKKYVVTFPDGHAETMFCTIKQLSEQYNLDVRTMMSCIGKGAVHMPNRKIIKTQRLNCVGYQVELCND